VTDPHLFYCQQSRVRAAAKMSAELAAGPPADFLCDGLQGISKLDAAESEAWKEWSGSWLSPKKILGEGSMAASAWQCVIAAEALKRGICERANVSVVGCNQQAIGAQLSKT